MALIDSPRLSLPSVDYERDHTSATRFTDVSLEQVGGLHEKLRGEP
jgi:hypothetical protein